jgi:hypothetical protein
MRKLLLITTALIALTGAAQADFVAVNGVEFNMMNLNSNNNPVLVSSGTDGADTIGLSSTQPLGGTSFGTATEVFTTASGFATIKPSNDVLNIMTFTPTGTDHFTSFSTRGQLMSDPNAFPVNVFIVVDDNLGNRFTFQENKPNQDFSPIGVEAVAGSGEFITSVSLFTDDPNGFKEIKQETFGFATQVAAVPEPSTWAMMILGFCGIVVMGARSRRREGHPFRLV